MHTDDDCTTCAQLPPTTSAIVVAHLHELHVALLQAHDLLDRLQPRAGHVRMRNEITRAYVTLADVQIWLRANAHLAPLPPNNLRTVLG